MYTYGRRSRHEGERERPGRDLASKEMVPSCVGQVGAERVESAGVS